MEKDHVNSRLHAATDQAPFGQNPVHLAFRVQVGALIQQGLGQTPPPSTNGEAN